MKVLIADDHWIVRESLKQVIRRLNQVHTAYEASSFAEALELLRLHRDLDLILVDLIMPGFDQFEGLRQIRREFSHVPIVVISVHEDRDHVLRAVEHGVIGYIPKSASGPEIERALERILSGEAYFPRRLLEQPNTGRTAEAAHRATNVADQTQPLTKREKEIVELLGKGFSVQRIANDLGLSSHTVRIHTTNLMKKLKLPDRSATIHYAVTLANARKS